jgi:hypothetical protein
MHQPVYPEVALNKIALGNLYLYHVLNSQLGRQVRDCAGDLVEPDEKLMRRLEFDASIKEDECVGFRQALLNEWQKNKMTLLYSTMGEVFDFFLIYEQDWILDQISEYPRVIPLVEPEMPHGVP